MSNTDGGKSNVVVFSKVDPVFLWLDDRGPKEFSLPVFPAPAPEKRKAKMRKKVELSLNSDKK